MGDSNTDTDLRKKLKDDERRKCPHKACDKWVNNFSALVKHCHDKHHLVAKNYCQYCRAPFGDNAGSKKARDVHEAKDHPPTSGAQKKQKKQTESVSKGSGKAKN